VLGLACYFGFVLFRSRFGIYYKRLLIKGLASPPPVMRLGGWAQLYSWLVPVFTVSDAELLRSCGLDALVRKYLPACLPVLQCISPLGRAAEVAKTTGTRRRLRSASLGSA